VNKIFARKILRIFGDITFEDIENEMRAVEKLCMFDTHKNIVSVFKYGNIRASNFYYIDMQMCDMNLEYWIEHSYAQNEAAKKKALSFTGEIASLMTEDIWTIMKDISRGLTFIHERKVIHRDIKPRNGIFPLSQNTNGVLVLYSRQDQAWKVADFGLTREGTSKKAYTTQYSRGTNSYRAPELIRDCNRNYTNKVDIWAVGCIFYELVFQVKAFQGDYEVIQCCCEPRGFEKALQFPFESVRFLDEARKTFVSKLILEMLDIDATRRPGAEAIHERFIGWKDGVRSSSFEQLSLLASLSETGGNTPHRYLRQQTVEENSLNLVDETEPHNSPNGSQIEKYGSIDSPISKMVETLTNAEVGTLTAMPNVEPNVYKAGKSGPPDGIGNGPGQMTGKVPTEEGCPLRSIASLTSSFGHLYRRRVTNAAFLL
jgi:serine/threonine protein kinase